MSVEVVSAIGYGLLVLVIAVLAWVGPQLVANRVVAAVYRTAINTAEHFGGVEWLKSDEGVAYRLMLVRRAYDALPSPIGPLPWKLVISRETFCDLVEKAFVRMLDLATQLEVAE